MLPRLLLIKSGVYLNRLVVPALRRPEGDSQTPNDLVWTNALSATLSLGPTHGAEPKIEDGDDDGLSPVEIGAKR